MGSVTSAHSMSLDGFIAGRGISWRSTSDLAPNWRNPEPFESCIQDGAGKRSFLRRGRWPCGAVVSGRRTYDVSDAWVEMAPMGPLPLFVVTHQHLTAFLKVHCRIRSSQVASRAPSSKPNVRSREGMWCSWGRPWSSRASELVFSTRSLSIWFPSPLETGSTP